jgi:hypothetical protein
MIKLGSKKYNLKNIAELEAELKNLSDAEIPLFYVALNNYAKYVYIKKLEPMSQLKFIRDNEWLRWINGYNA